MRRDGRADEKKKERQNDTSKEVGDVLGISRAPGKIPQATRDHGGHPAGIEVDHRHHPGATDDPTTTTDQGSGGTGTTVDEE